VREEVIRGDKKIGQPVKLWQILTEQYEFEDRRRERNLGQVMGISPFGL